MNTQAMQLLDAIGEARDDYLAAADAAPAKHKNTWLRWGAMAACCCLLAAAAVSVPRLLPRTVEAPPPHAGEAELSERPAVPGAPASVGTPPASGSDITLPAQEKPLPTTPAEVTNAPAVVSNAPGVVANAPDAEIGSLQPGNGPMLHEGEEAPTYTPMISGFGGAPLTDKSVENGGFAFSQQLSEALDNYGGSANYRVMAELFQDGVQIAADSAQALAELERLAAAGYVVAYEKTYQDGEVTNVFFTLHATAQQLESFSPGSACGWFLMLYDEYFGIIRADGTAIVNEIVNESAAQTSVGFGQPCIPVDEPDAP